MDQHSFHLHTEHWMLNAECWILSFAHVCCRSHKFATNYINIRVPFSHCTLSILPFNLFKESRWPINSSYLVCKRFLCSNDFMSEWNFCCAIRVRLKFPPFFPHTISRCHIDAYTEKNTHTRARLDTNKQSITLDSWTFLSVCRVPLIIR